MAYQKQKKDWNNEDFSEITKRTTLKRIKGLLNRDDLNKEQIKLMKKYREHLEASPLRLRSQCSYLQNLCLLLKNINKMPDKLTKRDRDRYFIQLKRKYKGKTIKERKLFFIYFIEWLHGKKKVEMELTKDIKIERTEEIKLPEELLSPKEIKRLTQVANNFRNKAIIMLLYETGARKGEFLKLKIKHIDIKEEDSKKYGFITVPKGKTTSRKLPIIYSLPHVLNWLNSHPDRDNPEAPLFINLGAWLGRPFGEDGLKRLLKILGNRAGIKKKIYPHLFRHSRMTELAKELTEQELKKFAGWSPNSRMASVYIHLSGEDVSNKILANAGFIDKRRADKTKSELMQIECPSCKKLNASDVKFCRCGAVLDLREAQKKVSEVKVKEDKIASLEKQIQDMPNRILTLIKENPENLRKAMEIKGDIKT